MQGKVSSKQATTATVYVGIDVCKEWLDIHFAPLARDLRVSNDKSGIGQLKRALARLDPASIVLEATGKFHRAVHRSLHADGFAVCVVNPLRARLFGEAIGYLAKTDRLDARMLAAMGQRLQPEPSVPSSEKIEELQELVHARTAAEADLTALKNRLKAAQSRFLQLELKRLIHQGMLSLQKLEAEIERQIHADPALDRKARILRSIPGIGRVTAAVLIADMDELGQCTGKQVAMLAGLAPLVRDSGAHRGQRSIRGGRAAPRRSLYMAALSASRHNQPLAEFARTLKNAGKPAKVVLVAVMRKLIVLANTLLAQDRTWQPTPP